MKKLIENPWTLFTILILLINYTASGQQTMTLKGRTIKYGEIVYEKDQYFEGYGYYEYISENRIRFIKHGQGTCFYVGGDGYKKGNYVHDKLNGQGEQYFSDSGEKYVGEFKNDKRDGIGTLTTATTTLYGYFKEGVFISAIGSSQNQNNQYHEEQVITKSKPANKRLSEYVIGNTQLDRKIEKLFDDMYIDVSARSFLGGSSNFDALVIQGTNEIKKQVEGWIGGSLSSSQYQEFKQIQQKAEQKVSSALQMFSNLSSVSASQPSQSSETRNNSSNSKSTSSDVQQKVSSVFICSGQSKCCRAVVIMEGQGRAPSSGRCPGGYTLGHQWRKCGESGNKTFQCADCGITVSIRNSSPSNGGCCPVRGCMGHDWRLISR